MILASTALGAISLGGISAPSAMFIEIAATVSLDLSVNCEIALTPFSVAVGSSSFPYGIADTPKNLLLAANNAIAGLASSLASTLTPPFDITLTGNLSKFASSGALTIDVAEGQTVSSSEVFYFDGKAGQVLTITARAQDGTTAKSFQSGALAAMRHIARHHNLTVETLIAVESKTISIDADVQTKAPVIHEHPISDVTGLQSALDENEALTLGKVNKTGDTMTGLLTLSGAPINANDAVNKAYLEQWFPNTWLMSSLGASGSDVQTTGSIASGSNELTVANATSFSVGHGIYVYQAGAGEGEHLITIITAIAGNVLTLETAAGSSQSDVLVQHDDTAAIQAGIDLINTHTTVRLLFDQRFYRINRPISDVSYKSILTVPYRSYASGEFRSLHLIGWHHPWNHGCVIQTTSTGFSDDCSMFSVGPYEFPLLFDDLNVVAIFIHGISWETPSGAMSGVDLGACSVADVRGCFIAASMPTETQPASGTFGLRLPCSASFSFTDSVSIDHYGVGFWTGDLWISNNCGATFCTIGIKAHMIDYPSTGNILVLSCPTGVDSTSGVCSMDMHIRWEKDGRPGSTSWYAPLAGHDIYDPSDTLYGQIRYSVVTSYIHTFGQAVTTTGATHLNLANLHV